MSGVVSSWVASARAGTNPNVLCRTGSGWALLGEIQVVRGYCLLVPDPVVVSLNHLEGDLRSHFLCEMGLLGDAVLEVTNAARINYEILGNQEPELHAHVFPRFSDEPDANRQRPVWFYDWDRAPRFSPAEHGTLKRQIQLAIAKRVTVEVG